MSRLRALVASVLVLTATFSPATADQAIALGTDSFVGRDGTQLVLDGQPFPFGGVNIYNANSDGWCAFQYTDAELAAAFDEIGPGQVVRAWFFQPLAASKTAGTKRFTGARDWTRFDRTLSLASQKGIRILATLTDQWGECGGSGVSGYKNDAWYRTGYTVPDPGQVVEYDYWVSYRDWVTEVVGRYANHEEILAWQLINEGEARTKHPNDATGVCPADANAAMTAWASDISTLVRSLDPNHLISIGTIGSGQCGAGSIAEYRTLHDLPNIDLCEFHDYNATDPMPGDQYNGLQTRIDVCETLDKPIFVGEVGIKPGDVGGVAARAARIQEKIDAQMSAGVVGLLAWIYNQRYPAESLDGYDIASGDPELAVLASIVQPLGPGILDPSFGTAGFTLTPFEQTTDPSIDVIEGFAVLPDGRLVASGSSRDSSSQSNVVVAVYDQDGQLDPSFGGDGRVLLDLGADDEGDGVAYQPGKGIVVGGYSSGELIALRFELDGDLDPTFGGGDGIVKFSPLGEFGYAWKTAIDPAGRIVMAGQVGVYGDILVARFEDDGDLDPTFGGGDGIARADMGTPEYGASLTFDASGRIIVTGTGNNGFHVYRFTDAGDLDSTFAGDGVATAAIAGPVNAFDAAVDAAGRIVAVGSWYDQHSIVAVRFEEDGDPDPTFDGDGVAPIDPTPFSDNGYDLVLQSDGRILLAGVAGNPDGGNFAIVRLLDDGSLDPSFAGDGIASADLGGQDWANEMALDAEGRLIVTGFGGAERDFALTRYLTAPPPDTASGTADAGAGGTATTGSTPTAEDPVETTVIVPGGTAGGSISITESDESTVPAPAGYDLLGQEILITAPAGDETNPLHLVFLFDEALAASAGVDENTIQLLRDGAPVAGCTATGPISPDPCISARARTADQDIRLDVLTSHASAWSGAEREPFAFTGFFHPIDNPPTLNKTKAGSGVPVKFSLAGDQGLDIFAATYPKSTAIACATGVPIDPIEQTLTAGSSSLNYNPTSNTYTYTWKTNKAWAGQCRILVLRFADGSSREAMFDFRR